MVRKHRKTMKDGEGVEFEVQPIPFHMFDRLSQRKVEIIRAFADHAPLPLVNSQIVFLIDGEGCRGWVKTQKALDWLLVHGCFERICMFGVNMFRLSARGKRVLSANTDRFVEEL